MTSPSLFITGTDTGVGKTLVTALLALRMQARGIDVGVMKPFASGCAYEEGVLVSEDARWLREISGVRDRLDLINPVRFEEPLAPLAAARRARLGTQDFLSTCREAYQELQRRHEAVLVEGIGGLLVPLQAAEDGYATCADFASDLGLPVVVVARRTLGTINHTLLTCQTPLRPPSHFAGIIFCDAERTSPGDVAAQTSPALIAEITGLENWGEVPYLSDLARPSLMEAAQRFLHWP
ncbi:MAG TPA: dethiobiotin synthase [Abditibacteriaceae bacterium]|nr:dethiobiotin synthase [Abditibacteriaceae bacterium]